jgi:hypothetical protein
MLHPTEASHASRRRSVYKVSQFRFRRLNRTCGTSSIVWCCFNCRYLFSDMHMPPIRRHGASGSYSMDCIFNTIVIFFLVVIYVPDFVSSFTLRKVALRIVSPRHAMLYTCHMSSTDSILRLTIPEFEFLSNFSPRSFILAIIRITKLSFRIEIRFSTHPCYCTHQRTTPGNAYISRPPCHSSGSNCTLRGNPYHLGMMSSYGTL